MVVPMTMAACSSDSATPAQVPDAGPAIDPNGDAGGLADASVTPAPSGFQTAVKLDTLGYEYAHESLVLGANDEPMIAFIAYDHDDRAQSFLYFVAYDATANTWKAPVKIDQVFNVNDNPTLREVKLARDPVTGQLGIAYYIQSPQPAPNGDTLVMLAQSADSGATWTKEQVAHNELATMSPSDNNTHYLSYPNLAMANGRQIVAYFREFNIAETCGAAHSFCNAWTVLSRTGTTGTFTGGIVKAATAVPYTGGEDMSGALAIDPSGTKAGFAWFSRNDDTDPTLVVNYLEIGKTQAVKVFDSNKTANDQPALALTFDRNQPRMVAALLRDESDTGSATFFSSSTDGVTWTPQLELPADHADTMSTYVAIAADQKGQLTIATDFTGGNADHGVCGGPKLATAKDVTTFTTCGADPTGNHDVGFAGDYVTVAYAKTGKRVLAFNYPSSTAPGLDAGVVVWREP